MSDWVLKAFPIRNDGGHTAIGWNSKNAEIKNYCNNNNSGKAIFQNEVEISQESPGPEAFTGKF